MIEKEAIWTRVLSFETLLDINNINIFILILVVVIVLCFGHVYKDILLG